MVVATRQGFSMGGPFRETTPSMQPSNLVVVMSCLAKNVLTHSHPQYEQLAGHSMAMSPPRFNVSSATVRNASQILRNNAKCLRILAAPPGSLVFTCCHGHPPVHGIEAHKSRRLPLTAFLAVLRPSGVVTSSSTVSLTTTHPFEAFVARPKTESWLQQNSTRTRSSSVTTSAGEAGSPSLTALSE